jgi:ornithine cyclodeaminase
MKILAVPDLRKLIQIIKNKPGRQNNQEITLFDSVGFALEDNSILRVVYDLAKEYRLGAELPLIPELIDPKKLFDLLTPKNIVL